MEPKWRPGWPENRESMAVIVSICRFHLVVLWRFIQKMYLFALTLECELRVQWRWFALYQWRAENGWLVMYQLWYFLPHSLVLLMMTLRIQTGGHKMEHNWLSVEQKYSWSCVYNFKCQFITKVPFRSRKECPFE